MLPFSSLLHLRLLRRHLIHGHHQIKLLSTTPSSPSSLSVLHLPLCHPTYLVWSSNTSLGKTLVSAGLASSFLLSSSTKKFLYLKPIQTGFPSDSDSGFVFSKLSSLSQRLNSPLSLSNSVFKSSLPAAKSLLRDANACKQGICNLNFHEEKRISGAPELVCKTLYAWEDAVSPHLAAERENAIVEDSAVVAMLESCLREGLKDGNQGQGEVLCIVETSGGVASPGPSGTLQCDLYRPLRLPGILVGDGRLGGISGTISAYESLITRGYDVAAVIFEDHGLVNEVPLMSYLRNRVPVLVLPPIPKDPADDLMEWFDESHNEFRSLKDIMLSAYLERMQRLHQMPKRAGEVFWWPFTQHKLVPEDVVTVIDSRCGENFAVFKVQDNSLTQQFDACASWWTQGPDAVLQTELAREMAYAAARFGHVMFPENVYEPALKCAELLLDGVGKGWASRAYFSDNGSTAIEIALKMAFRKFCLDHGIVSDFQKNDEAEKKYIELKVLALKGSYHGDTLGAMEAQSPSCYTGFLQQPWYTGRGLFLDPPTVFMCDSAWNLCLPENLIFETLKLEDKTFRTRGEIFNKSRDKSDLAGIYSSFISQQLLQYSESRGSNHIGAVIMEPVIQAAGGMHMIDPLFQRLLVHECQSRKIPVVFDEVFTGFWRLGTETAAELLGCLPDIACFGKLMTGGVIPLAATLATEAIFDSFTGESKLKALLHGHSYSAHAMGCSAAVRSMKWFKDPLTNLNITSERRSLGELWDMELVQQISLHPAVKRVVALGTLVALELQADGSNAGYGSLYARSLLQMLREDGIYMRPLGNVIYLMCGPCTSPAICRQLLVKLHRRLEEFSQMKGELRSCSL